MIGGWRFFVVTRHLQDCPATEAVETKKPATGEGYGFLRSTWCPGEDSNLHALRHTDLNRARLPVPPPGQVSWGRFMRVVKDCQRGILKNYAAFCCLFEPAQGDMHING